MYFTVNKPFLIDALSIALLLSISYVRAETQFIDEFDTLNQSVWAYPTGDASFNGRTQMRPSFPNVSNGVLHLQLDTYNPTGNSFYGSEIFTQGKAPSGTGLLAEFKAKLVTPVKGPMLSTQHAISISASAAGKPVAPRAGTRQNVYPLDTEVTFYMPRSLCQRR